MAKLQHESDMDNPKERFAWAFRGIEYTGFPMAFPDKVLEVWSEHLSKCGFVHDPSRQEIHYQPPVRGQDHALNTAGSWIDIDDEINVPVVPTSSLMTPQEKAKMIQEFKEEGLID